MDCKKETSNLQTKFCETTQLSLKTEIKEEIEDITLITIDYHSLDNVKDEPVAVDKTDSGILTVPVSTQQVELIKKSQKRVRCSCPNCEKGLNSKYEKKQHNCHIPGCNKVYVKSCHLQVHLRMHVGNRPFVCTWFNCGKRFFRSDEIARHMRTHTGEKNFECIYCDKKFMRSDHLSKHMNLHQKVGQIFRYHSDDFLNTLLAQANTTAECPGTFERDSTYMNRPIKPEKPAKPKQLKQTKQILIKPKPEPAISIPETSA